MQSPRRKVEEDGVPVQVDELTVLKVPPPVAFEWLWVALVKLAIVGVVRVFAVRVCVAPSVTTVSLPLGKAKLFVSVPVKVSVLLTVRVFPSAMVSVLPVAGAVKVSLLIVPGSVRTAGRESVHEPEVVIGEVPVTVSWFAVPTSPTLVTVPEAEPLFSTVQVFVAEQKYSRFVLGSNRLAVTPGGQAAVVWLPLMIGLKDTVSGGESGL